MKVDGEVKKPIKAYHALMSVPAGEGRHVITFEYILPGLRTANAISAIGFLGLLLLIIRLRKTRL